LSERGERGTAPVGLLPAAGRGVRFGSSGYAKELFPLLFTADADARLLEPRPLGELALRAIRAAGAERCVALLSPEKAEVLRVLGDGSGLGLSLAYVIQGEPRGLPHAIACAEPWLGGADVVLALPDTMVLPGDALRQVHERRRAAGADLGLGVFPVDEPERLGPVEMDAEGRVHRVHDKPADRRWMNSWALASWSARFTRYCAEWEARRPGDGPEPALGHVFEAARSDGLSVVGVAFESGRFLDIGTPRGLRAALRALTDRGILDQVQSVLGLEPER
jgi:glucose-1-phosphate thymidylyltransferase